MQESGDKIQAPIKGRLRNYLKENQIAIKTFCAKIGMSDSAFRGSGLRSELGGEIITRVLLELPELSARWLLTGESTSAKEIERPSDVSAGEQSSLAYAIAQGDKSSASANISSCSQTELLLKLLQEKDKQIQQLHSMIQILIESHAKSSSIS